VMCDLARGKTLEEAVNIPEEAFYMILETRDDSLSRKVRGLLELLNVAITDYYSQNETKYTKDNGKKYSWDGTMSD
jgi:hypothetical protein